MEKSLNNIKINSFNCRGLRNQAKRNNIFNWLKTSHTGITFLQESHSVESDEQKWQKEWGGKIFYSHGEFNARGVAILIPPDLENNFEYIGGHKDNAGRLIIINCKLEDNAFTLLNIYCPTKDDLKAQCQFLSVIKEMIEEYGNENLIIGGDLNTYLDIDIDKKGGTTEKVSKYALNIKALCEEYSLIDLWRVRHPDKKAYTRKENSRNGLVQSRLDYWLVSIGLSYLIKHVTICPGNCSDHSLITFTLDLVNTQRRGKGFWKFNNSLLKDVEYIAMIKETIGNIKTEFITENKNMLWEFAKCKIRTETMLYSSKKANITRQKQTELETKLQSLEKELEREYDELIYAEYILCKTEWENILKIKANGIKLRSKAKWIEDGEKNTKYFLNLEKRNSNSKYIKKLITSDNNELTDVKDIINEQLSFYENLYSSKLKNDENTRTISNEFLETDNIPKLNALDKEFCDNKLTLEECSKALKELANNKSPGSDGITTDFYKFFWTDIRSMVFESYLYSLKHNLLSQDQKLGIINLIPKKDKDLRYLKNWRPVSLLNTDYKILAKVLANRLHKVITKLVDSDQVGYIKDRYIGENIRKIFDILNYTEESDIEAILAQIDFEKAFDSIEWPFLLATLRAFNFGDEFLAWIKLLYTDISSCVGNNGYYSKYFKLSRSIRQGCPISALLFILVAEIIALKIRADKSIKGLYIGNTEIKISLMADDTTLILSDLTSLIHAITNFNKFTICSGLKLNIDKTEIVPLGKLKNKMKTLPNVLKGIKINDGPFKALGIWYSHNQNEVLDLNFTERIKNMNKLINIWRSRNLSLKGKITIIRSLILPQIQFLFSMVLVPETLLKEIDTILFSYIWNNKPAKIKRSTLIAPVKEGGLGMVDVHVVHVAAKCSWLKRLLVGNQDLKWKKIMYMMLNITPEVCNRNIIYSKFTKCKSDFHAQIMTCWNKLHNNIAPTKTVDILNQNIFYNQCIKIGNKHITEAYIKHCGFNDTNCSLKIKDIIHNNGKLLNHIEFREKHNIPITNWKWMALLSAIPKTWKEKLINETLLSNIIKLIDTNETYIIINNTAKNIKQITSKIIYQKLISDTICLPTSINKWIEQFPFMEECDWNKIFMLPFRITKEAYLQSFQYKILNRILNCNDKLHTWKIKTSNKCEYCDQIDTIEHHLFWCRSTQEFWNKVQKWVKNNLDTSLKLTVCEIIFGICIENNDSFDMINFIILIGKNFINKSRSNGDALYFIKFLSVLKDKLEYINYIKNANDEVLKDWERDMTDAL